MRLIRCWFVSVSAGLSAEGGADSAGVTTGFESGGGGGGVVDAGANKDDGGSSEVDVEVESEEEDSTFVVLARPFFPACAEEAASSATNETAPMILGDIRKRLYFADGRWASAPSKKTLDSLTISGVAGATPVRFEQQT